jgi:hypothetical protein
MSFCQLFPWVSQHFWVCGCFSGGEAVSGRKGYSDWRWWINRPAISKPPSGRFFILRRFRQVFSCQSEPPSELFCRSLHPSPRDVKQHPIWLRCLSSRNERQGAREDLARRCAIEAHFRQLPEGNTTRVNVVKAATYLAPKGGRGQ